jgi:hypothetical protein
MVKAIAERPDFQLVGQHTEMVRDKTEWAFVDLETGLPAYLSHLAVGTESEPAYLVLMPDGRLYRGWLGPEDQEDRIDWPSSGSGTSETPSVGI